MTIQESIGRIKAQLFLKRTVGGKGGTFPINDDALGYVQATIEDEKNYGIIAVKCDNCGLLVSKVVIESQTNAKCPVCGYPKFQEEQKDI